MAAKEICDPKWFAKEPALAWAFWNFCHEAAPPPPDRLGAVYLGKGQLGSALMGSLQFLYFLTGTFWVLPLMYFYLPQSAATK